MVIASLIAAFSLAALALGPAPSAGASMKGSYYKAMVKAKKSKKAATQATKAAMKGTKGFYGFRLKKRFIPAKEGTLIWSKRETGKKNRPEASRTENVLYSSKTFPGNRKTVVSGTVMIPKGKPPAGGWPVISWAHGTVGLADQCAPSRRLGDTAYYGSEGGQLIGAWLSKGYAVVATDYEGLGTPGIHPYLVGNSEGRGVLDIVKAARQLNGKISKRVVLTGHSQGGQAILFAANLATTKWGKGANYLGTVSYAPASNLVPQANLLTGNPGFDGQWGLSALALSIVRGMTVQDPRINPAPLMTDKAKALYPKTDTVCLDQLSALAEAQSANPGDLFQLGWQNTPNGGRLTEALNAANPALRIAKPVLIPQGDADTTVQPSFTAQLVGQLNALNPVGRISYEVFPGATHSSILLDSRTEVDQFIGDLFNP